MLEFPKKVWFHDTVVDILSKSWYEEKKEKQSNECL